MSNSRKIFGRKLKYHRKRKNLSLQQSGDLLGVDKQYVWKLENGRVNMTVDYLDNVIIKLGTTPEKFHK